MKILFVLEHFHPYIGGAEKLFYELAIELAKQHFDVTIVTTQFDKALPLEEVHKGIKVIRVNCKSRFSFTLLSLPTIIRHARTSDLIHCSTYNAALPASIAGKIVGKQVFVTFHEVWGRLWKELPFTSFFEKNAFFLFEKLLLKLPFTKFIAVSKFTQNKLAEHGIPQNKIVQIYNGIQYAEFESQQNKKTSSFTYTFFGRLGISKGLNLLLPAAGKFKSAYPNSTLRLIIPKYPKNVYNQVMKLLDEYKLRDHIEILHNLPKDQLRKTLASSSCVVIPSYSEGFCFAAAETVALGVPIISSGKGALAEVVSGRHIVMEEQSSESLYLALEKAYKNEWQNTPVQYFHLDDSVEKYMDLYGEI